MTQINFKESTIQEVVEAVEKKGYVVKGAVQFPHPKDYFLWLVLVKTEGAISHFMYNTQDGGLSNGHYGATDNRAYETFADRLKTKIPQTQS